MCDTHVICVCPSAQTGSGAGEVVGGAAVGFGRLVYWCAERGAEVLIWAGRWLSGKPLVSLELWRRPYRLTRPVRAAARILLTTLLFGALFHPVITGLAVAAVVGLALWLRYHLRRRYRTVPRLVAVLIGPSRAELAAASVDLDAVDQGLARRPLPAQRAPIVTEARVVDEQQRPELPAGPPPMGARDVISTVRSWAGLRRR